MNYKEILQAKKHNNHYLTRYCKLIEYYKSLQLSIGDRHHICPKAKDMFPKYRNFTKNTWNCVVVTRRQHYLLHWVLAKAYPGTSQTLAFYYMTNNMKRKRSKDYEIAKTHTYDVITIQNKEKTRRLKISKALKGKPKSKEHVAKLMGHTVSVAAREKLRLANLGKKHTKESKEKMSLSRTGVSTGPRSDAGKHNIAQSKMIHILQTPIGQFTTFLEVSKAYNITLIKATNIFRCLDNKPQETTLKLFNIDSSNKGKSYRELGFDRVPK